MLMWFLCYDVFAYVLYLLVVICSVVFNAVAVLE